jgi:hypothetical protein
VAGGLDSELVSGTQRTVLELRVTLRWAVLGWAVLTAARQTPWGEGSLGFEGSSHTGGALKEQKGKGEAVTGAEAM